MGVTIHYRGRLDDISLLESLRDELADIAETLGWPSATLDDDWSEPPDASLGSGGVISGHLGLRGITISPHPGSESLDLFFDREGTIRSPMTVLMLLDGTLTPETACESIKTQFANADSHIWVIGLLKYLKKKYISDLEVNDEGHYWETGERDKLEQTIAFLNGKIEDVASALESEALGDLKELSAEDIAARIEKLFGGDA